MHEIWDTKKRPSLRKIMMEEVEAQLRGKENIFNKKTEDLQIKEDTKKRLHSPSKKVRETRTPEQIGSKWKGKDNGGGQGRRGGGRRTIGLRQEGQRRARNGMP